MRGNSLKFENFHAIARIKGIDFYSKSLFVLFYNVLLVLILVFALSGLNFNQMMESSSYSFVIAIDNSESMNSIDIPPNRLTFAKDNAIFFIDSLPYESYTGILSFSGNSKVESKLTKNKEDLKETVKSLEISDVKGTDIVEAIVNSGRLLSTEKNKAVILMSDGQINTGSVSDVISYAKDNNITIHTIGIGTVEGGNSSFFLSKLDEDSLKSIAYNTGGRYYNVIERSQFTKVYPEIIVRTQRIASFELRNYLIIASLILFTLKSFLSATNRMIW